MWIVRLALRRPYSVAVLAVLLLLFGGLTAIRMPKDIFPTIDIPVVIGGSRCGRDTTRPSATSARCATPAACVPRRWC